jgi:NAD(P)-dependent dehydrogenase (short-subunit alcohol dehydrogenase family)
MDRLKDKVAIVTGGSEGIGRAISEMFAAEGAIVVIANRNETKGSATVAAIAAAGGHAEFVRTDVSVPEEVERLMHHVDATYGRLQVLCNNHAVQGKDTREITDLTVEAWDLMMDVNAKGVFLTTKYGVPLMRRSGGGSIVNVASIGALVKSTQPAYAASKGAVVAFTKGVAAQMGEYNIRANVICPSTIETPNRTMIAKNSNFKNDYINTTAAEFSEGKRKALSHVLPIFGEVNDVAYAAVYLASDESGYITGATVPVDGGTLRTRTD